MRRSLGSEPEAAWLKIGFEDRLDHRLHGRLHDAVANRRDRQRTLFSRAGLGYPHPAGRQWPVSMIPKVRRQLVEQSGYPIALNVGEGLLVDARSAAIASHLCPCAL